MIAAMDFRWVALAILVLLYVLTSARVARQLHRTGHNGILWFLITLIFTAIPASIVLARDHRKQAETDGGPPTPDAGRDGTASLARCRHCGGPLDLGEPIAADEQIKTCPHCGMGLDEGHLA
jgi:hypothetical protein